MNEELNTEITSELDLVNFRIDQIDACIKQEEAFLAAVNENTFKGNRNFSRHDVEEQAGTLNEYLKLTTYLLQDIKDHLRQDGGSEWEDALTRLSKLQEEIEKLIASFDETLSNRY